MINTVVLVVDVQNDFCEGGSLAALNTLSLIQDLNSYLKEAELKGYLIAFTKDCHKETHMSFINNGGKWTKHCVAGTLGAELHRDLYVPSVHTIINKGIEDNIEGYSAFENTNLNKFLKKLNINKVIVCGIATSYCVVQTAIDSVKLGFKTSIIKSLTRDVASGEKKELTLKNLAKKFNIIIE